MLKIVTTAALQSAREGKALRMTVPRSSHAEWTPPAGRADPIALLESVAAGRLEYLLPLRNARMAASAFAFYRGSAAVMAADLATTPTSGLRVQACGDAHCSNFGGFGTPERNTIFDINDFDETLNGPWEWDVKRLVTSIVLAGRHDGHKAWQTDRSARAAIEAYRTRMRELAIAPALDVWYSKLDATKILDAARVPRLKRRRDDVVVEAATTSIHAAIEKITERTSDGWRFREDPPLLFHAPETARTGFDIAAIVADYVTTLSHDVAHLLSRYTLTDCAIKIVGVGSVGTRCGVALLVADDHDALLLQIKEARPSVLEPYLQPGAFDNHGERVVRGQRLMQAASDMFLGWARSGSHDFYVRQFKDMKTSAELENVSPMQLREYARYCGLALAAAHARTGNAAAISGYIGRSDVIDRAMVAFARAYAEQSARDYAAFCEAVRSGTLEVAENAA